MKNYSFKVLILLFGAMICSLSVYAQNDDNAFQQYLANIQPVLSKNVETMNSADIELLQKTITLSPTSFGAANQRLCAKMINDAKIKKQEYDEYLKKSQNMANTLDILDDETSLRMLTEQQRDSLFAENAQLKSIIEELNKHIDSYKAQARKLKAANKKLQDESLATKDLLETSSNLVAQLIMLMPKRPMDAASKTALPKTLQDSLEQAQCDVAQLLKSNYMITLESMKADKQFMDTAVLYFETNKRHLPDIISYMDAGHELIYRLRNSGVECAIGYATDIENEMNTYLLSIENASTKSFSLIDFIRGNLLWLVPVLLLLIAGIVLVAKKTSKK